MAVELVGLHQQFDMEVQPNKKDRRLIQKINTEKYTENQNTKGQYSEYQYLDEQLSLKI